MQKTRGFTLIELIIVITIIGILVAIAVPSYQNHLRKGRRAEAQGFVTQIAQRQRTHTHANQALHRMLHRRKHAPHLAFAALVQRN